MFIISSHRCNNTIQHRIAYCNLVYCIYCNIAISSLGFGIMAKWRKNRQWRNIKIMELYILITKALGILATMYLAIILTLKQSNVRMLLYIAISQYIAMCNILIIFNSHIVLWKQYIDTLIYIVSSP